MNAMRKAYLRGRDAMDSAENDSEDAADSGKEKKIERVIIEPTDNKGFIVECDYKAPASANGGTGMPPPDSKKAFKTWDEAESYLDDIFGE